MTRHKSFTTAASRRKADPIVWTIDNTTIRLRPFVDLIEIAEAAQSLQAPLDEGSLVAIAQRRTAMVEIISTFVEEEDRTAFNEIGPLLDLGMLVEMTRDAIAEYAGLGNSGADSSSSDGLSPTGASSTDGAPPTE